MKSIREVIQLIPDHILDMDLTQTFLVGFDKTDVQVQFDQLVESKALQTDKQLSDKDARRVVDLLAERFDPEIGINNGLIRQALLEMISNKEIVLE